MTCIQFQYKSFSHPHDCLVLVGISLHPAPPPYRCIFHEERENKKTTFYPRSIKVGLPYTPQSLTTTQKLSHVNKDFSIKKTSLKMHYVKTLNQDLHLLFLTVWTKQRKETDNSRHQGENGEKKQISFNVFGGRHEYPLAFKNE